MKKIFSVIFMFMLLFLIIPNLQGCGDEGFELVYEVKYTTNGEDKKDSFTCGYLYADQPQNITENEYDALPNKYQNNVLSGRLNVYSYNYIPYKEAEPKGKTRYCVPRENLSSSHLTGFDENYFRYYYVHNFNTILYFKRELLCAYYDYVYVKINSPSNITIRKSNGETTYEVTSYKLTKFTYYDYNY